jgi:23S rRNA (pseudouridine1915-N3)-methyltransferase
VKSITLAAVGKLRTPAWRDAQTDYATRIRRYAPFDIVEIKDRIGQGMSEPEAMTEEGADLLKASDAPFRIALSPEGKLLDSPAFAVQLTKWLETYPKISFVLGGPAGLSESLYKGCQYKLALSPMTFPHELARIAFLEQLYRAFSIRAGEKYHR